MSLGARVVVNGEPKEVCFTTDSQLLQLVPSALTSAAAVDALVATRMVKPKTSREEVEEVPCILSPESPGTIPVKAHRRGY